jgi:hypothetical protein
MGAVGCQSAVPPAGGGSVPPPVPSSVPATSSSRGPLAPPSRLVKRVLVLLEVVMARLRVPPALAAEVTSTAKVWPAVIAPEAPTAAPTAGALAWVREASVQLPLVLRTLNPVRLGVSTRSRSVARRTGPAVPRLKRRKLRTTGAPSTRRDLAVPPLVGASARVTASAVAARVRVEVTAWLAGAGVSSPATATTVRPRTRARARPR